MNNVVIEWNYGEEMNHVVIERNYGEEINHVVIYKRELGARRLIML